MPIDDRLYELLLKEIEYIKREFREFDEKLDSHLELINKRMDAIALQQREHQVSLKVAQWFACTGLFALVGTVTGVIALWHH